MNRYNRHIILSEIGAKGQQKLCEAKVLVVGAGGLGCPVLQYLAAAGIGTLGIVDFDVVEESNLQRQILFGSSTLGINKALAAKERLLDLNPTIIINAYPQKLDVYNITDIFKEHDIIVDGTDNFATRYLINDAAILLDKPVVYGAIFKFEGQVSVFNYDGGPSYRCLFPEPPEAGTVPNCSEIGVLGVLPGIIGTMQANEVLKLILGIGTSLSGKLFFYDAMACKCHAVTFRRNDFLIKEVLKRGLSSSDYLDSSCESHYVEIMLENALLEKNVQFIDVRETDEQPRIEHPDVTILPLSSLEENIHEIDAQKVNILFCQSGIRSKKAVSLLREHKINNCYSLKEGAASLEKAIYKNKVHGNNI